MKWKAERDHSGAPRAIAIVTIPDSVIHDILGKGNGVDAIDWVALRSSKTRRSSCGSYRSSRTGRSQTILRVMTDHEYVLFDRRSGTERGRRTFEVTTPACPPKLSNTEVHSLNPTASEGEARLWMTSLLQK